MAATMRLQYLVANAAYVFTFGDSIIEMGDVRIHETRQDAVRRAEASRLKVARNGDVTSA